MVVCLVKLNLGSGFTKYKDFVNIDLRKNKNVDIVGNFCNLGSWSDGSVEEIISRHSFEHVPYFDSDTVLGEWFRVLRPEGKLNLIVPDVELTVKLFLDGSVDFKRLMHDLYGEITPGGFWDQPQDWHRSAWCFKSLNDLRERVGFSKIRRVPTEEKLFFDVNSNQFVHLAHGLGTDSFFELVK